MRYRPPTLRIAATSCSATIFHQSTWTASSSTWCGVTTDPAFLGPGTVECLFQRTERRTGTDLRSGPSLSPLFARSVVRAARLLLPRSHRDLDVAVADEFCDDDCRPCRPGILEIRRIHGVEPLEECAVGEIRLHADDIGRRHSGGF